MREYGPNEKQSQVNLGNNVCHAFFKRALNFATMIADTAPFGSLSHALNFWSEKNVVPIFFGALILLNLVLWPLIEGFSWGLNSKLAVLDWLRNTSSLTKPLVRTWYTECKYKDPNPSL